MGYYAEAWDRRDRLQPSLATSVLFHAALLGSYAVVEWMKSNSPPFGDDGIPGAVSVTLTDSIPLPSRGPRNRVANDTESQVPVKPKQEVRQEREDPAAVDLGGRKPKNKKKRDVAAVEKRYRETPIRENEIGSTTGSRASSSLYSPASGGGGVGVGSGGPFGTQFGWYGKLVTERIAQKWRTQELDARLQSAPPLTVVFDITQDGTARNINILKGSGNYAVDTSARRAVMEASPFPRLPNGFNRSSASVEINFQLKR